MEWKLTGTVDNGVSEGDVKVGTEGGVGDMAPGVSGREPSGDV